MAETIQPGAGFLLVQPIEKPKSVAGGQIAIPDEGSKERPVKGRVIAVGAKHWEDGQYHEAENEAGDLIIYHAYAGIEYKDEDRNDWRLIPFTGDQRPVATIKETSAKPEKGAK